MLRRLLFNGHHRFVRSRIGLSRRSFILGIESSCDDSGAAILSLDGQLLGEGISTQLSTRFGGVIPSFAMGYHAKALPKVVDEAFSKANIRPEDLVAIAVTTKPGLSGSLLTGSQFAQYLSRKHWKPVIPIHHMEAHALTPRMAESSLDFPFMVMLVSGGHCLLAIARDINDFLLLGSSHDTSPGEVLDKVARRLRVHTLLPEFRDTSGGKAIEILGRNGNPAAIKFPFTLAGERSCRFSWSGFKTFSLRKIDQLEDQHQVHSDQLLPNLADFCASVEFNMARHLCQRLQRGFIFSDLNDLWPRESKTLVLSGGVGCNKRIRNALKKVCDTFNVRLVAPEPKYCTDNGLMIAWNGLEKFRRGIDLVTPENVFGPALDIEPRAAFGVDISDQVLDANIKCSWVKLDPATL